MSAWFGRTCLWLGISLLWQCTPQKPFTPVYHPQENPVKLSDWQILDITPPYIHPTAHVWPYDINTPLFSDYARKFRTLWIPNGQQIGYHDKESFNFPVGTIISKSFYYPIRPKDNALLRRPLEEDVTSVTKLDLRKIRLIETRLLVRRPAGWIALPYVWNDTQTEATLKRTGALLPLTLVNTEAENEIQANPISTFHYQVPNINQCAGSHVTNQSTRELLPIGLKARHLNRDYDYGHGMQNQLQSLAKAGLLVNMDATDIPRNASWPPSSRAQSLSQLESQARAYLDINCSHCHNPVGPADTSGLHYQPRVPLNVHFGLCKPSIAAGGGTGERLYDLMPGAPEKSIMLYRMELTDPANRMPELGRALVHKEGVKLIRNWISQLPGNCPPD